MTRQEFLKISAILGLGMPVSASLLSSHAGKLNRTNTNSVIIIGAGAAGLSAGYLLGQKGIDYQILEASGTYGGRMKRNNSFADFPIPLGAEWLETTNSEFDTIVNNSSVKVEVPTVSYQSGDTYFYWDGNKLSRNTLDEIDAGSSATDKKFINGTWFDFFDQYVVPSVRAKISYNTIVESIDYSSDQVTVHIKGGQTFTADKVIFTAPLKQLQTGNITFTPALPANKQKAIDKTTIWDGIKVFFEFKKNFYPTFLEFEVKPESSGERLYYDAAYGQNTEKNILGFFSVGTPAQNYTSRNGDDLKDFMMAELDQLLDNQATPNYIKHTVQHWGTAPFQGGAYVNDHENWRRVRTLGEPLDNKVFFAGEAYTDGEDWGSVNNAAQAARVAVESLVG